MCRTSRLAGLHKLILIIQEAVVLAISIAHLLTRHVTANKAAHSVFKPAGHLKTALNACHTSVGHVTYQIYSFE